MDGCGRRGEGTPATPAAVIVIAVVEAAGWGGGGGVGGEESGFVLAPLWLRQEKEFVGLFLFSCLKPREASVPSHGPRAAVGRVTEGLEMSWFTSWATPPGGRDLPALC